MRKRSPPSVLPPLWDRALVVSRVFECARFGGLGLACGRPGTEGCICILFPLPGVQACRCRKPGKGNGGGEPFPGAVWLRQSPDGTQTTAARTGHPGDGPALLFCFTAFHRHRNGPECDVAGRRSGPVTQSALAGTASARQESWGNRCGAGHLRFACSCEPLHRLRPVCQDMPGSRHYG